MISEFFIDCGFSIVDGIFSKLPAMEWTVDTSAWTFLQDFVDMICYLLPLGTVKSIVTLIVSLTFIRIVIAFIRTIFDLIPFV